jgi:hypothetical protein
MTSYEGTANIVIRRLNKYSTRIAPPVDFMRERGLADGDVVRWIPQQDGSVRLEFIKKRRKSSERVA